MKNRKKRLSQLVVALLIVYTVGLPIQNIVLAMEQTTNETIVTEKTETKESTTTNTNASNSESIESETVPTLEPHTQASPSETMLEEGKALTDTPDVNFAEKQESSEEPSSSTQQNEKRPSTKAVTSGGFPNGSTATWQFDDTTGTLTISGGTLVDPNDLIVNMIWGQFNPKGRVTNIVLEDKVFLSGSCARLFDDLYYMTSLNASNLDTSQVTDMSNMFNFNATTSLDVSNFDTSKVTNMYGMFCGNAATSLDVSNFDTSNVTNMSNMFNASAATSLDVSNFDTSNVTDMSAMFCGSAATSLDMSSFDTSNVTDMSAMFYDSAVTSLDVSNFDTSSVMSMGEMFRESVMTSLDVSSFDTSKVTDMSAMFYDSAVTSLDVSNFDTSSVTSMVAMFEGCTQLQNLTLGSQFQFGGTDAKLPNPTPTADYTGKWQNVGSGTVDKPKGSFVGTGNELMSTYDGSTMADTYVWQPVLLEVNVQDSILMVGDTWNPENNFVDATDSTGNLVDFNAITVTGSVDTTQPGVYPVTYTYGGVTSTATVTVLETMPASWINFFVDGTNVRSIPGTALSTPKWNLTTGLWTGWNPGTIKVPTDKIPSEPTKQGYVFKGWKDNTGTMVDFNTLDLDLNSQHEFNFYAVFEKVNSTNPIVEPPVKPGEGPNVVSPTTPGSGGNQTPSNGSGLNPGNTTITSQGNISITSPATSQGGKLAKLGENSSLFLQGFGLLLVLSGTIFFLFKRKNTRY
ncbi:BspA family leucine-rich repeat surface protein [Listeria monocytogenes]|uniref:BspA family leucine-rich repeat surface protein n=1 Tax=Listeria monocytogenes TaxID=1639 RepID=UPI00165D8FEC|nr:BspA family leucine-rich repeat surface protein [Listeria monocytogenes]